MQVGSERCAYTTCPSVWLCLTWAMTWCLGRVRELIPLLSNLLAFHYSGLSLTSLGRLSSSLGHLLFILVQFRSYSLLCHFSFASPSEGMNMQRSLPSCLLDMQTLLRKPGGGKGYVIGENINSARMCRRQSCPFLFLSAPLRIKI